ncbi:hypothetical protein ACQBAU_17705 [Propionibacteriaceae bacterium Y2011]
MAAPPADRWVYAPTLAMAEEALPAAPVRQGHEFLGWFRQPGASGAPVSSSTILGGGNGPTTVPLYAGWTSVATPTTLLLSPTTHEIVAGESVTYTVTGADEFGNPVDVSGAALTSSEADDEVSGWSVTAQQEGVRTITASVGNVTATASLTVSVAPVATLWIAPKNRQVVAGSTISYVVVGEDEFGNPVDVSGAALTSSETGDEIRGWLVTPESVGFVRSPRRWETRRRLPSSPWSPRRRCH